MAGLLRAYSNSQLDDQDTAKRAAEARQAEPLIVGLAAYLHRLWNPAWLAKKPIENKMLRALRQRNGEYEPDKIAEIKKQGGSEIFMMVTETKCRGAESWLRDILLEDGEIPFDGSPTPIPNLPPEAMSRIHQSFADKVINTIQQLGQAPDPQMMEELQESAEQDIRFEMLEEAENRADAMRDKIRDQFAEGGLIHAFNEFISDLSTYPAAFIKGPYVSRRRSLEWVKGQDGKFTPQVQDMLSPTYTRVDPFRVYPEPGISNIDEGYLFEHHRLSESDLSELIGVPGYDDDAIRAVLKELPNGGATNWMWSAEMQKSELEQKHLLWMRPTKMADALEFWGKISGSLLIEWGMTEEEIPDPAAMDDVNAWMINRWVIKATLNYDALGKKPYRKSSFFKRPGSFWGSAIPESIEDIQTMCNAAARALANNMGIASGPQVEVNVERLPGDEDITKMYPWKIWQTLNDPLGSGQPAIRFTQPDDHSQQLMMVYQHFSKLADDHSGVPAYIYGDGQAGGGAGRTASGLSMLMGSAGKGIRQVIMYIDLDVIDPLVTAQFNYNMRYDTDDSIKGDVHWMPKGAVTLANREQLNVRRVEFLQATANPIDAEIVGKVGRAEILREVAKGLSMPVEDIVPTREKLQASEQLQKAMQAAQASQQQQPPAPAQVSFNRGPQGEMQGMTLQPGGAPAGGQDGNTVSNRQTGQGG